MENEAELDLLRTRVQKSEQCTSERFVRDDPGTTLPSSQLDAGANVFRPAVRTFLSIRRNHTPDSDDHSDDHSGSWTTSRGNRVE